MINLIKDGSSNVIAISPATASSYHDLVSGSFRLNVTQDYNQTSASLDIDKLPPVPVNTANKYLLFSVPSSEIPSASGFYSYDLVEGIYGSAIWAQVAETWGAADIDWNDGRPFLNRRTIDSGRVKNVGSDVVSFTSYGGGPQNGYYKTYNG